MPNSNRHRALRSAALMLVAASGWLGVPASLRADNCVPARMMVVLDRSTSMKETIPNSVQTKWQAAQKAVGALATRFDGSIDLGLMIFPDPSACSPGRVVIAPAPKQGVAINAQLATGPVSNAWTPMSQSIDVAAAHASLADPSRRPALLVVTDGWQWCSPYDASTRFFPVEAVKRARAKGITVYVVGFGRGVDVLTLNRMASAAGTAFPGCDPTGADWMAPKKCYFQAEDQATLEMSLAMVAVQVSAEACDGIDNNCDGQVDEHLSRACQSKCSAGSETCKAGKWEGCDARQPVAETCDGKDNDCNGSVDEGCDCVEGETRSCGIHGGLCRRGVQRCLAGGVWAMGCEGEIGPRPEVCNGGDDDCDDFIDEEHDGSLCPPGQICRGGGCEELPPDDRAPDGGSGAPPNETPDPNDPNGPNDPGDPNDPNHAGNGGLPINGCGCTIGQSDATGGQVGNGSWLLGCGLLVAVLLAKRRRRA